MRAVLSFLVLVATATSTTDHSVTPGNTYSVNTGGPCVPSVLKQAKAPSWPMTHDITVDATKIVGNISMGDQQDMLQIIAQNLLTNRQDLIAVILESPPRPSILAFNRYGKIEFRNRSVESEMFWKTVDSANTGWAPPFRECTIIPGVWMHAFIVKSASRAAVGVFLPVKINQCDNMLVDLFEGKHNCDEETTRCVPVMTMGLHRDSYRCVCRPGYFAPANTSLPGSFGTDNESGKLDTYKCQRCPEMCDGCEDGGVCLAKKDYLLKTVVLGIQLTCMGITVILVLVVFKKRKCKTIASAMWTVLETILLGIFLLYATVAIRFFEPSVLYCLLEPWARELGFVVCYGAIILKLYRHLIEFRTRKAHRWVVKDTDLLKYLLIMLMAVVAYMAAYTAISLNFLQENYSLLTNSTTVEGLQFQFCKPLWWDYVTELGELVVLIFGIHLSYACRNASTQFQERRFLCASICIELIVSVIFYVLRALYLPLLHPDHVFLAYFLRSQFTSTIIVFLIFMPKLWYQYKQARSLAQEYSCRLPVDAFKSDVNAHGPLAGNNSDVEVGEVSLADMSPDDIRAELKRLYMQLEILKNKTIRTDNPHISKRRGGRKVPHRRFSLQKKGSREKTLHNKQARSQKSTAPDTEAEASRTPEDSVCSIEGPSVVYNDLPSTTYSDLLAAASPRP